MAENVCLTDIHKNMWSSNRRPPLLRPQSVFFSVIYVYRESPMSMHMATERGEKTL